MAKTYKDLWPAVVSWEALVAAYQACRKRKRSKRPAVEFDFNWETNLLWLQQDLVDGRYRPGPYRHFYIFDPKKRKISAAPFRDRIVHHAVVRVLEPIYERRFIFDSFACRKGKGTKGAVERAQQFLQRYDYYLKTDVVSFFPSVDHEILLNVLQRHIRDKNLLRLIELILQSGADVHAEDRAPSWFPGDDLFAALRPKGLPLGNLTSQFFANVLLDQIDHVVKEQLRIPAYVRYADDLVLFGDSKGELRQVLAVISDCLAGLRLRLHKHKTQVARYRAGLPFLGLRLQRDRRPRLLAQRVRRFSKRLRRQQRDFADSRIAAVEIQRSLKCWLGNIEGTNSKGLRNQLWRRVRFHRRQQQASKIAPAIRRFSP